MPQKITHTIEWEPVQMSYRVLRLTGSQRQPTMAEARSKLRMTVSPRVGTHSKKTTTPKT